MSLEEEFRALVDSLPSVKCKRLCARHCRSVPVSPAELLLLTRLRKQQGKVEIRTLEIPEQFPLRYLFKQEGDPTCPLLQFDECTVYELRPLICRFYGIVDSMKCSHGCVPSRWVSHNEADALYKKMADLTNRGLR